MPIGMKRIAKFDLSLNAPDGQVHLAKLVGGGVALLSVNGKIALFPSVCFNELLALHEHPAGPATAVINPALIGLKHFDQKLYDTFRCIKLAAFLSFGVGELTKEVFIHPAKEVLTFNTGLVKADISDKVNKLS